MYTAIGRGVRTVGDGKDVVLEVVVEIQADGKAIDKVVVQGADLDDIKAQLATTLKARKAAEQDADLSRQVVGVELGSV